MNARCLRAACAASCLLACSTNAFAIPFYAANASGTLSRFDTVAPASAPSSTLAITGIGLGETLIGIDIRPLDQKLYAITRDGGNNGRLYSVDFATAAATLVAPLSADPIDLTVPYTSLSGSTRFGMAFNPTVDRIRLVGDNGQNYRVNPSTGLVITDNDLNPGTPHVIAVAYTNSFTGSTATSLYDIDTTTDALNLQNPPNNGTLTQVGAGLGVNMVDLVGFDITTLGTTNYAYATALVGSSINLYSIDLVAGTATPLGNVNGNFQAIGIAIVADRLFANGYE